MPRKRGTPPTSTTTNKVVPIARNTVVSGFQHTTDAAALTQAYWHGRNELSLMIGRAEAMRDVANQLLSDLIALREMFSNSIAVGENSPKLEKRPRRKAAAPPNQTSSDL